MATANSDQDSRGAEGSGEAFDAQVPSTGFVSYDEAFVDDMISLALSILDNDWNTDELIDDISNMIEHEQELEITFTVKTVSIAGKKESITVRANSRKRR